MARLTQALAAALLGLGLATPTLADERVPYELKVEDASGKVGEPTAVRATLTVPEGYRFTSVYRHRIIDLSAQEGDDGLEFERPVVTGEAKDQNTVVFEVPVTPTKAGTHPINGVIRASFLSEGRTESKSIPLMAKVVAE